MACTLIVLGDTGSVFNVASVWWAWLLILWRIEFRTNYLSSICGSILLNFLVHDLEADWVGGKISSMINKKGWFPHLKHKVGEK